MVGYTYCSVDSFLKILQGKKLFLSDPLKMNDSKELLWYLDLLESDTSLFEMAKNRMGFDISIQEIREKIINEGQENVFIACFSKNGDLLSQWRGYGDDGKGVSIGFELNDLKKIDKKLCDNLFVKKVKYQSLKDSFDLSKESDIECIADEVYSLIRNNKLTDDERADILINELLFQLVQYKHPSFVEEKETRVIYAKHLLFEELLDEVGALKEKLNLTELQVKYRVTGDNITGYVEHIFDPKAIKNIVIGPKCSLKKKDIERITRDLLDKHIPEISISKSTYQ